MGIVINMTVFLCSFIDYCTDVLYCFYTWNNFANDYLKYASLTFIMLPFLLGLAFALYYFIK